MEARAHNNFKIFYNQSIYPELFNLEMRRKQLVLKMLLTAVVVSVVGTVLVILGQLEIGLFVLLFIGFWVAHLVNDVRIFYQEYKPRIVGLILDFLDNDINYSQLSYDAVRKISKEKFEESKIFNSKIDEYLGEDYIFGKIREMPFEMCELRVGEISPVRGKVNSVFSGIFCIGDFLRPEMSGIILLLPDTFRRKLTATARTADLIGAQRVSAADFEKQEKAKILETNKAYAQKLGSLILPEFEAVFDTYASPDMPLRRVLSEDMQKMLLDFRKQTGREMYVSIVKGKIYIGVHETADLLEPTLFSSVLNYKSVKRYYEDLRLLLSIVHQVDVLY